MLGEEEIGIGAVILRAVVSEVGSPISMRKIWLILLSESLMEMRSSRLSGRATSR